MSEESATPWPANKILVIYGSYRTHRVGIRLAEFVVRTLSERGELAELVDAKAIDLPMLDRMYKEYPRGTAPAPMEALAHRIRAADGFVFIAGEYNWGIQPGLKNLIDHFLEEWFWRPAAVLSYSAGPIGGARSNYALHGTLSEMGMVVISSAIAIGPLVQALDEQARPIGDLGAYLSRAFGRLADDLAWWMDAARLQRARRSPPY